MPCRENLRPSCSKLRAVTVHGWICRLRTTYRRAYRAGRGGPHERRHVPTRERAATPPENEKADTAPTAPPEELTTRIRQGLRVGLPGSVRGRHGGRGCQADWVHIHGRPVEGVAQD